MQNESNKTAVTVDQPNAPELTFGQKRVGVTFNPSKNPEVDTFKSATANAIDELKRFSDASTDPEAKRAFAEAMTQYENACMWAVKAFTK